MLLNEHSDRAFSKLDQCGAKMMGLNCMTILGK